MGMSESEKGVVTRSDKAGGVGEGVEEVAGAGQERRRQRDSVPGRG